MYSNNILNFQESILNLKCLYKKKSGNLLNSPCGCNFFLYRKLKIHLMVIILGSRGRKKYDDQNLHHLKTNFQKFVKKWKLT